MAWTLNGVPLVDPEGRWTLDPQGTPGKESFALVGTVEEEHRFDFFEEINAGRRDNPLSGFTMRVWRRGDGSVQAGRRWMNVGYAWRVVDSTSSTPHLATVAYFRYGTPNTNTMSVTFCCVARGEWEIPVGPTCMRLYITSNHPSGSSNTPESGAAPDLGNADASGSWTGLGGAFDYVMLYSVPGQSGAASGGEGHWAQVDAPLGFYGVFGAVHRLDGALLAAVQSGGTASAQLRAHSRHGVGINEGAQNHVSAWCLRVYRPGTGFVATLLDVANAGSARFVAQSLAINRRWGTRSAPMPARSQATSSWSTSAYSTSAPRVAGPASHSRPLTTLAPTCPKMRRRPPTSTAGSTYARD